MDCAYCQREDFVLENELAGAFFADKPRAKGDMLIIPKAHVENFVKLSSKQKAAIDQLIFSTKKYLDQKYQPNHYNLVVPEEDKLKASKHLYINLVPSY
ncbi:HIT family protein [Loigolactobacillus iwatensis]|uniref:HIT family protein n=1 Tax=Loigolactobacillus iwatensis TaxID=1267156 RepID=UPI000F7E4E5A|nr:HIT domain-containing protein [Loigolactobacillus iwatensis]